jgi:crotonobetainyl-CoA:carnitine CoA-transferase CaiB-like acyl-CoA transferase
LVELNDRNIGIYVLVTAYGADVLLVTAPNLPNLPLLDIETSRGKRTTQLDLTLPSDRETLTSLAKDSDVFLQAYRPGGIRAKGFGPEELAKARPGIVYAGLSAYGWEGPWKDRRGVRFKLSGYYNTII